MLVRVTRMQPHVALITQRAYECAKILQAIPQAPGSQEDFWASLSTLVDGAMSDPALAEVLKELVAPRAPGRAISSPESYLRGMIKWKYKDWFAVITEDFGPDTEWCVD
jgi:hypothetical protein